MTRSTKVAMKTCLRARACLRSGCRGPPGTGIALTSAACERLGPLLFTPACPTDPGHYNDVTLAQCMPPAGVIKVHSNLMWPTPLKNHLRLHWGHNRFTDAVLNEATVGFHLATMHYVGEPLATHLTCTVSHLYGLNHPRCRQEAAECDPVCHAHLPPLPGAATSAREAAKSSRRSSRRALVLRGGDGDDGAVHGAAAMAAGGSGSSDLHHATPQSVVGAADDFMARLRHALRAGAGAGARPALGSGPQRLLGLSTPRHARVLAA